MGRAVVIVICNGDTMIVQTLTALKNSPRVSHANTDSIRSAWLDVPLMQQAADMIDAGSRRLQIEVGIGAWVELRVVSV